MTKTTENHSNTQHERRVMTNINPLVLRWTTDNQTPASSPCYNYSQLVTT